MQCVAPTECLSGRPVDAVRRTSQLSGLRPRVSVYRPKQLRPIVSSGERSLRSAEGGQDGEILGKEVAGGGGGGGCVRRGRLTRFGRGQSTARRRSQRRRHRLCRTADEGQSSDVGRPQLLVCVKGARRISWNI